MRPRQAVLCALVLTLSSDLPAQPLTDEVPISSDDWRALIEHRARGDVTYRPGVDVYGRPVVQADANEGTAAPVPEKIPIVITRDLLADIDDAAESVTTQCESRVERR